MEFCPGIYEHAAAVVGRRPWEVSRSRDLLVAAHLGAWQRYRQRMVVVGVDIYNIEPESLRAVVAEPPGDNVPAIVEHPFSDLAELRGLAEFNPEAGRIPLVLTAATELVQTCAGAEVRVPVCGPMSFANGLVGMESLLIGLVEDPELACHVLRGLVRHQIGYLEAIQAAGARPIIFESGTTPPLLPVALFESIEVPLLRSLFDSTEVIFGERPPCIIGGNATLIVRELLEAAPGYVIAPSETDQAGFLAAASSHPEIHVRVNMPSAQLASAGWNELERDAVFAVKLAATRENTSVGCGVVPFETDPELLVHLRDFLQGR